MQEQSNNSQQQTNPKNKADKRAPMQPIIEIKHLNKTYASGFKALKDVNLTINKGEIFALLGPNGAGKTTLISTICGIVNPTSGTITIDGHDNIKDYRETRQRIGLVPQELTTDAFESVTNTVSFSRGLFGKPKNPALIEKILKDLSLWDKKDNALMELSGGMKRRVLIAKALSHEPDIIFLDEPSAGVDVELRKDMWEMVYKLAEGGTTIILTTHYIEEAEQMADRVGVISDGELILVEDKETLMQKMGKKQLTLHLTEPLTELPSALSDYDLKLETQKTPHETNTKLTYTYDARGPRTGITSLLNALSKENIKFKDLDSKQSSLEQIFVELVNQQHETKSKETANSLS